MIEQMRAASEVPFSAGTRAPKLKVPANACDCHMHFYDRRFPAAANATLRPPDAHVEDYRLLQQRIGTTRNVVVTPSTYGTDNRCTLEAMARIGSTARGIAVVDTRVSDAELKRLADLGVRGIRVNLSLSAVTTVDMIEPLARRIHGLGWHVQLLMPADHLVQLENLLLRLPVPIVFDHFGRIPPASVEHRAFGVILKLLDQGNAWVKLSARTCARRSVRPVIRMRPNWRVPSCERHPNECSGEATGRMWLRQPERQLCRMTRSFSTCCSNGGPTTRRGEVSSLTTQRNSTASSRR